MTDNLWTLIGVGVVAYLVWKYFQKNGRPRLGVMDGGRKSALRFQFHPVEGPEPQLQGSTPQVGVLSWPGDGSC